MQPVRLRHIIISMIAITTLISCGDESPPPPKVTAEQVTRQDVTESKTYIATIQAVNTIELVPRVEGFLIGKYFTGGDDVETGQVLFKIQPEEFIANLKQAQADLASAQATLANNTLMLTRIQDLSQKDYASKSDQDNAQANYNTAFANVEAAQAKLVNAELNLSYTDITSPINGRIGYSSVNVGDLVAPRSGIITSIVQLDPIYAVFSMSENDLLDIKLENNLDSQKQINDLFTPVIKFQSGETYPLEGSVESMDNKINAGTGTITVKTVFDNQNALLLPGQFVNIDLRKGDARYALTVPARAVLYDKQGYYVLIVNEDNEVEIKYIKEGVSNNTFVEVVSGLSENDRVITEGMQKAKPGIKVDLANENKKDE